MLGLARRGDHRAIGPVLDALRETEVLMLAVEAKASRLPRLRAKSRTSP